MEIEKSKKITRSDAVVNKIVLIIVAMNTEYSVFIGCTPKTKVRVTAISVVLKTTRFSNLDCGTTQTKKVG